MTSKTTPKKKGNRAELLDLEDLDKAGMIESTIRLEQLTLKDKKWKIHLKIGTLLPRSYHRYNIKLELDEKPYTDRIEELESNLNASLFSQEKVSVKQTKDRIKEIRNDLEKMRNDCELIEFSAVVDEIKWRDGDTLLCARIPDDVIDALNRQKFRFEAYKIALIPVF